MIIGIGCDHAAFTEKQLLIEYLKDNNHSVVDFGCNSNESVDYPDYAHTLSKELIDPLQLANLYPSSAIATTSTSESPAYNPK